MTHVCISCFRGGVLRKGGQQDWAAVKLKACKSEGTQTWAEGEMKSGRAEGGSAAGEKLGCITQPGLCFALLKMGSSA